MNNDRELLELAAKAAADAGMPIIETEAGPQILQRKTTDGVEHYRLWIPQDDDGDALRLAVKLKLIVTFADAGAGPHVCAGRRLGPFSNEPLPVKMFTLEEELAATRRAIVRAAAEIGRLTT